MEGWFLLVLFLWCILVFLILITIDQKKKYDILEEQFDILNKNEKEKDYPQLVFYSATGEMALTIYGVDEKQIDEVKRHIHGTGFNNDFNILVGTKENPEREYYVNMRQVLDVAVYRIPDKQPSVKGSGD